MKILLTVLALTTISVQLSAQFCTEDDRFTEVEYFSFSQIDSLTDVTYGNALNWLGESEDLKVDFYFPANDFDTLSSRPFVLLVHGGGFEGGDRSSFYYECRELAKRGYVAATMDYRLGFDPDDNLTFILAVYRAQQDANAAIRYSIDIAPSIKIDTSWIFLGGGSAGSITSLYTQYKDQAEWEITVPGIESLLGAVDNSGNNLTHTFELDGLLNQWGASSGSSTNEDELIPMISFHGALDDVVPSGVGQFGAIGSEILHDLLIDNGICSDFSLDPTGDHVVYSDTPEENKFRVNRMSCFFKSLFCENCTSFFSTEMVTSECATTVSINEISNNKNEVSIFPNPFKDQLNFKGLDTIQYFFLNDISGQTIYEGTDISSQDFSHLPFGFYVLLVWINGGQQTFKLIKE